MHRALFGNHHHLSSTFMRPIHTVRGDGNPTRTVLPRNQYRRYDHATIAAIDGDLRHSSIIRIVGPVDTLLIHGDPPGVVLHGCKLHGGTTGRRDLPHLSVIGIGPVHVRCVCSDTIRAALPCTNLHLFTTIGAQGLPDGSVASSPKYVIRAQRDSVWI